MQLRLRCFNCSTPYVIKDDEIHSALNKLHEAGHKHYNAFCPKCGKSNKVSKKQLKMSVPKWEPPKE